MAENLPALVEETRNEIAEATTPAERNALYVKEQALLTTLEGVETDGAVVTAEPTSEEIDSVFEFIREWDFDGKGLGADLRHRWGADAGRMLQAHDLYVTANPDEAALVEERGYQGHPVLVELAAMKGLKLSAKRGAKPSQGAGVDLAFQARIDKIHAQIRDFQARGLRKEAAALYQQEQAMYAAQYGNAPIVDGSHRT